MTLKRKLTEKAQIINMLIKGCSNIQVTRKEKLETTVRY